MGFITPGVEGLTGGTEAVYCVGRWVLLLLCVDSGTDTDTGTGPLCDRRAERAEGGLDVGVGASASASAGAVRVC